MLLLNVLFLFIVNFLHQDLRHAEWKTRMANIAALERSSPLHSSVKRLSSPNASHRPHQPETLNRGWSSSGHPQKWSPGFMNAHGQSFGRPSSVPAQISRPFVPKSPLSFNQTGFDYEKAGVARRCQSPGINIVSCGSLASHVQYKSWSRDSGRDSGSEPVLGGASNRHTSDPSVLQQQQQQHPGRQQMNQRMIQQHPGNKNQHWHPGN